jgi:hypothetical protein
MAFLVTGCGSSTGGVPDNSAPTATITEPIEDATGIPVDNVFEVVFDTVMDPASINESTVYLVAQSTDEVVAGTATLLDDGMTVLLTTAEAMLPGEVYQLVVSTGVMDLLGNSPVSDLTSVFTVSDVASTVVPVVWPVADTVLSTEAAQTLLATLSSLLGVAGDGLSLVPADLTTLVSPDITINDLLAAVQAVNPAAATVEALMNTPLSVGTFLGIIGDLLPVGGEAVTLLNGVIAQLPSEITGTSMTLNDILTLPAELLPLDPLNTSVTDVLAVATNPLALLESVAQIVDAGALVNLPIVGEIIASVTEAGGLQLVGGVLSQLPGLGTVTTLIPTDLNELIDTILATDDPAAVITALLDGLGGNLLTDILGGVLGGTDLLDTLTTLLGADLAALLSGLLEGVTTDPTATLERLLGMLNLGVI